MEKDKKKTVFVRQPEYPGGPKELSKFIQSKLQYPERALEAEAEGTVIVDYDIDYKGDVIATRVLQSVGHGCDEEACRVVKLLKFDVAKNRGMKVLFHKKTHIQFKKPVRRAVVPAPGPEQQTQMQVQYSYTATPAAPPKEEQKPATATYSYSIQL